MFTEFFIAHLAIRFREKVLLDGEDDEMVKKAKPRNLNELKKVHEVLSCLIRGVYAMDKADLRDSAHQFWESVGYQPVNLKDLDLTGADYDRDQFKLDLEKMVNATIVPAEADVGAIARLVLFRRCAGAEHLIDNGVKPEVTVLSPEYVVAIRGTILQSNNKKKTLFNLADIIADFKILLETFHAARDLYDPVTRLVEAICRHDGAGVDRVWIAGHSLGAMIAFVATRNLALLDTAPLVLCPHLFNLPYSSIFASVNSLSRSFCQTIDKGFAKASNYLFGRQPPITLDGGRKLVVPVVQKCIHKGAEWMDPKYADALRVDSVTLMGRNYFPTLYLNPKDPICRGYIDHFSVPEDGGHDESTEVLPPVKRKCNSMSSSFLRCVKINAQSCNRVIHARLIINHWGKGPKQAHKLHQWFLYPTVDKKVYRT